MVSVWKAIASGFLFGAIATGLAAAPALAIEESPQATNTTTESRWVRSSKIIPGEARGVHHILAGYIPGIAKAGPEAMAQWQNSYGEFGVGGGDWQVPEGWGVELPAGGTMGFQMHYTPFGKESVDNSKMGLYFYPKDQPPKYIMRHSVITNNFIEIAAEKDFHKEVAYQKFPKDATLFSLLMHSHLRGQAAGQARQSQPLRQLHSAWAS